MTLASDERAAICVEFGTTGPDLPTLCEGWTTAHLAAHLVVRERDPRSGPGIVLGGRFEALLNRLMAKMMDRGYPAVVERVRNGPPLGPFAVPGLRKLLNLNEYVVHHEDARRANGLGPRADRTDLQDTIWSLLRRGARLMLRKVKGASVRLCRPDGQVITIDGSDVLVDGVVVASGTRQSMQLLEDRIETARQSPADERRVGI